MSSLKTGFNIIIWTQFFCAMPLQFTLVVLLVMIALFLRLVGGALFFSSLHYLSSCDCASFINVEE